MSKPWQPKINHFAAAPIWYSAAFGSGEKVDYTLLCPCCGTRRVRVNVQAQASIDRPEFGALVIDLNSKDVEVRKHDKHRSACFPFICEEGHKFQISIGGDVDEDFSTLDVTLADETYEMLYPAEFNRWG